jgi:choline dehydrogenase-like flavoprotein
MLCVKLSSIIYIIGTRNVHDPDYQIFMAGNQECLAGFPVCSNRTICFWGAYLRPQNRGHVRLTANNFTAPLNISIGYLTVPGDMTKMVNMSQIMTNITQTPIFKSTFNVTDNFTPKALGLNVTDFITQTASTLIHYTGTSSIGQVVDTHLLVKGVTKLRVVDASAIPVLISGNTQAATYMVGLKAAMAIRATYNLPSW